MQSAGGEQIVVRGIDYGHRRVVLAGEPADVRGVFDAPVDGEAGGAVEVVVQKPVGVGKPPAKYARKGGEGTVSWQLVVYAPSRESNFFLGTDRGAGTNSASGGEESAF